MYFVFEDDELLKKYNDIRNELSNNIQKILIVPHLQIISKDQNKHCGDEATPFIDKEMPAIGCNYICLAVILIDFFLKIDENYYLGESLK